MEQSTDLKAILHSKRANIYYLEKCRVTQKDGRVLYLTESRDENLYWNIPIANTTVITEEGLIAVKTLLRKIATKNTAEACHWIRSRSRRELV